ncbi:hypothetical protein [Bradyrhizobium sp. USDA 4486]
MALNNLKLLCFFAAVTRDTNKNTNISESTTDGGKISDGLTCHRPAKPVTSPQPNQIVCPVMLVEPMTLAEQVQLDSGCSRKAADNFETAEGVVRFPNRIIGDLFETGARSQRYRERAVVRPAET